MGEVVSFAKARQNDIFSMFDAACPLLPDETNREVVETAERSVGDKKSFGPDSFRAACLLIAVVSLCGLTLSFFGGSDVERHKSTVVDLSSASVENIPGLASESTGSNGTGEKRYASDGAFSSNLVATDEFTLDHLHADKSAWRNNREAWLAHIASLENHPYYQKVVREKRLFSLTHPDLID